MGAFLLISFVSSLFGAAFAHHLFDEKTGDPVFPLPLKVNLTIAVIAPIVGYWAASQNPEIFMFYFISCAVAGFFLTNAYNVYDPVVAQRRRKAIDEGEKKYREEQAAKEAQAVPPPPVFTGDVSSYARRLVDDIRK